MASKNCLTVRRVITYSAGDKRGKYVSDNTEKNN